MTAEHETIAALRSERDHMRQRIADLEARAQNQGLGEAALQARITELEGFEAIVEAMPVMVSIATLDGRVRYINAAGQQMLGLALDPHSAEKHLAAAYPPAAYQTLLDEALPAALRAGVWRGETTMLAADGRALPVAQTIFVQYDAEGEPAFLGTIARDTSAQKQAEQALNTSEDRYQRLVENVPGLTYELEARGEHDITFLFVSDGCKMIYGVEPEYLRQNPGYIYTVVHPDDLPSLYEAERNADLTQTWLWEGRLCVPDEPVKWIRSTARMTVDAAGRNRSYGITLDITAQKIAEQMQISLQEDLLQAQATAIAELSTPLLTISAQIVLMPLIGSIDGERMERVVEVLLTGISQTHASVAILDISGVPVVDTNVASGLMRAAQAVKLLGVRVVLTGIRPEVAQTLVGLGVDLRGIVTRSTLQSGIAYALAAR